MAITPSWTTSADGEEYIDKGAVTTPQTNPEVESAYAAGKAQAAATDKVEWPTTVAGLTN